KKPHPQYHHLCDEALEGFEVIDNREGYEISDREAALELLRDLAPHRVNSSLVLLKRPGRRNKAKPKPVRRPRRKKHGTISQQLARHQMEQEQAAAAHHAAQAPPEQTAPADMQPVPQPIAP